METKLKLIKLLLYFESLQHVSFFKLIETTTLESLYYVTDKDSKVTVIGDSIILSLSHTMRMSHTGQANEGLMWCECK